MCLSDKGRDLVQDLGWQVYESVWERMQRLHEKGNYQGKHTVAALAFVYQARLRGWIAGVIPEVDAGLFFPDAVVEKGGESYYVEVELIGQKLSKWHNMARLSNRARKCTSGFRQRCSTKFHPECSTRFRPRCTTLELLETPLVNLLVFSFRNFLG